MRIACFVAFCLLALGALLTPQQAQAGLIYDLSADWSDTANPNGVWSYNNSNGPITIHQSDWAPAPEWAGQDAWAVTATGRGHIVAWLKTDRTLSSPYDLAIGDVDTHTWDSFNGANGTGNLSSVTWTAPVAGIYDFSGNLWQGVHIGRSADAFVFVGGAPFTSVSLFDGDGYSRASPFTFGATGVSLSAGDTIELRFVTTSQFGTHVGVNLTVSSSVESICDIQMSQASYVNGETVTAQVLRIANPTAAPLAIELKLWFDLPTIPPISFVNIGANGDVVLPAGFDQNFGPLPLATVTEAFPRGTYGFNCRILHPVTGGLSVEDLNPFDIR